MFSFAGYTPVSYFFYALLCAAFVIEAWAFIDAIRHPAGAYVAASKQTKPIWLIILGVAFVLGLYAAAYGGVTNILAVAAFVAAAVYLADVRPKVRGVRSGSSSNGPYGPW
jgi:hypothetical protein